MRSSSVTVCHFLKTAVVCGGVFLGGLHAHAADPTAFKIGGVVSLSGPYGIFGTDMRRGVELAVESRQGKVLGVPIEVMWEDDETKPQPAVQKTNRLISAGAHTIFGPTGSAATVAVMGVTKQRKVPHLITASADDKITVKGGSRYMFRTSNMMQMHNRMMLNFAVEKGIKRVYGVTADYQALRDSWAWFAREAQKAGIEIIDNDYTPIGTRDFSSIVDKIVRSGADGVALFVTGSDSVTLIRQAAQVNMHQEKLLFGPIITDETMAAALGDLSLGVYSGTYYHFSVDTPANKAFVEAYRKKYGAFPTSVAGEAYDGMRWWLDVVDSTGSWDKEKWVAAFENSVNHDSVEGVKTMRACDHQALQDGLWGVVVKGQAPQPEYVMNITNVYAPAQVFDPC